MPKKAMSVKDARAVAERIAAERGVELIDVELAKESVGRCLRFYVDRPEGGITLDELEGFHRQIQALVEDVEYDFMEVSSPGVDRPLKTERDFERAEGMEVELKTYRPVNGAKQFRGGLIGLRDGRIEIETAEGALSFERRDVAVVRPVIEFTEEDLADETPAD